MLKTFPTRLLLSLALTSAAINANDIDTQVLNTTVAVQEAQQTLFVTGELMNEASQEYKVEVKYNDAATGHIIFKAQTAEIVEIADLTVNEVDAANEADNKKIQAITIIELLRSIKLYVPTAEAILVNIAANNDPLCTIFTSFGFTVINETEHFKTLLCKTQN